MNNHAALKLAPSQDTRSIQEPYLSVPHLHWRSSHQTVLQSAAPWPLLDVSIVTYNSSAWLRCFFKSLVEQDYSCDRIRLLATDNGSTDESYQQLEEFSRTHGRRFAEVLVMRQINLGFGAAHNRNLQRAAADYFLVTNVDLEFELNTLTRIVAFAIASPSDVASWECRQKPYEHPKYYNPVTLETRWSSSACVLFRTICLRQVGGYDEKLFLYGEDVDVSYRLRDQGYRLLYYPHAVCWHYTYASPMEFKSRQFLGNSLANLLLRLRFDNCINFLAIPFLYLSLWRNVLGRPKLVLSLIQLVFRFFWLAPSFILSRRKSRTLFPFRRFDYERRRDGAFFQLPKAVRTTSPLVSVIMRTYQGRLGYLREAVASVLNQTYANIELIVVEDGTTEFAREFLKSCQDTSSFKIRYCAVPKKGRSHAGNEGLAKSQGEFLAFLDDDDYLFADHIETLVTHLLDHPHYVGAYSIAVEVATKVLSLIPFRYEDVAYRTAYRQPFCQRLLWQRNYIPIQSMLFHRQLYERYGGFDEEMDMLEDWNLWTRYSQFHEFVLVEKTTSAYRVPATMQQQQERVKRLDSYYQLALRKQQSLNVDLYQQVHGSRSSTMRRQFVGRSRLLRSVWSRVRTMIFK